MRILLSVDPTPPPPHQRLSFRAGPGFHAIKVDNVPCALLGQPCGMGKSKLGARLGCVTLGGSFSHSAPPFFHP